MTVAVIVFPGSNCDNDIKRAIVRVGGKADLVFHKETSLDSYDSVVLPGGFSYGDCFRPGYMASQSPIIKEIVRVYNRGARVLGICNGFQILTEIGLLNGNLTRNITDKFICRPVELIVNNRSSFTKFYEDEEITAMPIAHHSGNYQITNDELKTLQDNDLIAFQYVDNPNGSTFDIAGIFSEDKRILGLMPHPERMYEEQLSGLGGKALIEGLIG